MTPIAKLIIQDEVNCKFANLDPLTRRKLVDEVKYYLPYARHLPAVKLGRWDGSMSYCDIGGRTYINLLDRLLPIVYSQGYEIEIEDHRQAHVFEFEKIKEDSYSHITWPKGHPLAGQPIMVRDHQVEVVNTYLDNLTGVFIAPTGAGKAQPLYSKIKTPGGWTTMGEIKVGDVVSTPDGQSAPVVGIYPQGKKTIYQITFSDGRTAESCKEHLWEIYSESGNTRKIISLDGLIQMMANSNEKFYIQLVQDLTPDSLSIDEPYTLGRKIGLINAKGSSDAGELTIPEDIAGASVRQKEQLIAGMVDCGGKVTDTGKVIISTRSKMLAIGVQALVWSIGGVADISNLEDDFVVTISYRHPEKLTLDSKNQSALHSASPTEPRLYIENISYSGEESAQCIMIDHPDHLYITDNYVVTHNTIITSILSHKVEKYGRSIVIVPTKDLVTQTEEDYINFGLDVGVFYGDRKEYNKTHTICTWQSLEALSKKSKSEDLEIDIHAFFDGVVCVIADETHKVKGEVLRKLLSGPLADAPIRWGLTGTMPEEEHEQVAVISCLGPVLNKIETSALQEKGILANLHVNVWQLQDLGANAFGSYQAELKWLTSSPPRIEFLASKFVELAETGNTLILVDRVQTGEMLQALIPDSIFVSGKMKSADRKNEYKEVQQVDGKVIIATYGVASTGININRIFNLVLLEAGKSFVRVIQSIGRGIRVAEDKDFVNIYDVCSVSKYSKQHLTRRKKFYKDAQYPYTVSKISY